MPAKESDFKAFSTRLHKHGEHRGGSVLQRLFVITAVPLLLSVFALAKRGSQPDVLVVLAEGTHTVS